MLSRHRAQAGDTIIEVLIVLAILSTSFALAYSTATRGLSAARQAQEHSEALQFISSQVELLRNVDNSSPAYDVGSGSFCMTGVNTAIHLKSGYPAPPTAAADDAARYPAACTHGPDLKGDGQGLYRVSATYDAPTNRFKIYVRWDGPGSRGPQQESITVRQYKS
jgi:prepilin-type N-terminal cleavage/methylation domain-containing protein